MSQIAENKSKTSLEELSYRQLIWQRLCAKSINRWCLRIVYLLIFFAIIGDFIANDRPIYYQEEGKSYWPVFRQYASALGLAESEPVKPQSWLERSKSFEAVIWTPIRYAATNTNVMGTYISPKSSRNKALGPRRHWLGTDQNGRDIAAGMIAGCRIALLVGIVSMIVAALLGLLFGGLAGFFGDKGLNLRRSELFGGLVGLFLGGFYAFLARAHAWETGNFLVQAILALLIIVGLTASIAWLFKQLPFGKAWQKTVKLPVDTLIMRLIEIINSVPTLLFLLAILAIVERSLFTVILVIGLLRWTTIARFVRAELLRVRQLEYVDAARSMGLKEWRILGRHALPNALQPALITLAFGIAGAIILEAYLSFLGIGLPQEMVTWGSILRAARESFSSWWLVIFPGLAIFLTVTVFNILGEALTEATGE